MLISSSSLSYLSCSLFTDTHRAALDSNQIGDAGAQYLADALRDNKVMLISSSSLSYLSFLYLQTLTELYLYNNQIGDAGAQYLADALRDNKVMLISFSSFSYLSFSLFTDTHRTGPQQQSNRRCWSSISR